MSKPPKIIVGMGFGDEGKGTMVDYLCQVEQYDLVVRFNGGAQAGHTVVRPDGREHVFSSFGSGIFSGARTLLSHYVLIDPIAMENERLVLEPKLRSSVYDKLYIDQRCAIVTPFHIAVNRLRESLRRDDPLGDHRHGSVGKGIGELAQDIAEHRGTVVTVEDCLLNLQSELVEKIQSVAERKRCEVLRDYTEEQLQHYPELYALLYDSDYWSLAHYYKRWSLCMTVVDEQQVANLFRNFECVFEGAQGILLDEWYGFHPHTTWSTTTPENALTLLKTYAPKGQQPEILGVTRTYTTRHGAGPLPTYSKYLHQFLNINHHPEGEYTGVLRGGYFDEVLFTYAKHVCEYFASTEYPFHVCVTFADMKGDVHSGEYDTGSQLCFRPEKDLVLSASRGNFLHELEKERYGKILYSNRGSAESFIKDILQKEFDVSVAYTSHGPSFLDKRSFLV